MRKVAIVLAGFFIACGGEVVAPSPPTPGGSDPETTPAVPPAKDPVASPPEDAEPVVTTASRDGAPLYLSMCHHSMKAGIETIFGEITDPTMDVDEGIIAFDLVLPTSTGTKKCTTDAKEGVVVVFAEARRAAFTMDAKTCKFTLTNNGGVDDVLRGNVDAEYIGYDHETHHFQVDFAAPRCAR